MKCDTCVNDGKGYDFCHDCFDHTRMHMNNGYTKYQKEDKAMISADELVIPKAPPASQQGKGMKYDGGKLRASVLRRTVGKALRAVQWVLHFGAEKYAEDSWRDVPDAQRRYADALERHLNARQIDGEIFDAESKRPHYAHVAANAMFLAEFDMQETGKENA